MADDTQEFTFRGPEGQTRTIRGPKGATPEQARQMLGVLLSREARAPVPTGLAPPGGGERPEPVQTTDPVEMAMRGRFGGDADTRKAAEVPETGPTWQQATQKLMQLQKQGVPESDPRWQQALKERSQGFYRSTVGGPGELGSTALAGPVGELAGRAVAPLAKRAVGLGRRLLGEAGEATAPKGPKYIEALRGETASRAESEAGAEAAAAREIAPQLPPELQAMRSVAEKNSERIARTQDLRNLGFRPDEAKRMVAQAERRVQETEQAVTVLEQHLLQLPQTTPEQFGLQLRGAAKQIYDNAAKVRENQAGFGKALQAGDERGIQVKTESAVKAIEDELKKTRNPSVRDALQTARHALGGEAPTAEAAAQAGFDEFGYALPPPAPKPPPTLGLRQADSARKWIQQVIQTRRMGDRSVDKEAVHALQRVAGNLIEAAQRASPEYKEALTRYRIFSRPLDVVERKGALRKVLDKDPMTTDYLLSEAKVVGEVIKKAQAGNPVFSRLLEQSPGLKDSARLYFTHDLFGKEAVPSPVAIRNWLALNERPLKQLGLYDEFRNLRLARETAQKAVQGAKEGKAIAEKLETRVEAQQQLQVFTSSINSAAPEKVPGMAREFLTKLGNEGKMTPQQLQRKLTEITRIEERYKNAKQRAIYIRRVAGAAAATSLIGAFGYGGYHVGRRVFGD